MPSLEADPADILGLTKINDDACANGDGLPVTIRFADKVGDYLTMGSAKDAERQPFTSYVRQPRYRVCPRILRDPAGSIGRTTEIGKVGSQASLAYPGLRKLCKLVH